MRKSPPTWASILRKERRFSTDFNFSSSHHQAQQQQQQNNQPSVFDIKKEETSSNNGGSQENEEEEEERRRALLLTHPKKNKGLRTMTMTEGAFNNTIQAINTVENKLEDVVGGVSASSYNNDHLQLQHHRRASFSREDHRNHHHQGPSVIVNGNGVLECRGNNSNSNSNGSNSSGGCSRSSSTISVCSSGGGRSSVSPLSEDLSLSMLMRRSPTDESATPGVQDLSIRRRTSQDEEDVEFGVRCKDIRYLVEEDDELPQDLSVKKTEPKIYNREVVEDLSVKKRKFTPPPPPLTYEMGMWNSRPPLISYDLSSLNSSKRGGLPVSVSSDDKKSVFSSNRYPIYDGSSSIIEVKILPQQYPPFDVNVAGNARSSNNSLRFNDHTTEGELMIIEDASSSRCVNQRRRSTGGLVEAATAYSPVKEEPRPESVSSTSNMTMNVYDNNSISTTTSSEIETGAVMRRKRGRRRKDEIESGMCLNIFRLYSHFSVFCNCTGC